jgi:proton glutamate symport protein
MKGHVLAKVLFAIFLAILAGWLTGTEAAIFGVPYIKIYTLIGQLFLNALTLVVVPLVATSIITGTARMSSEQSFGVLGAKTFSAYIGTNFLAILIGAITFLLISPGTQEQVGMTLASSNEITQAAQGDTFDKFSQIFLKLVPSNIFAAASQGQMLGLISFSLLFGFFLPKIESQASQTVLAFCRGIFEIMMKITHLVMKALPIGVFGLVAKVVATAGLESFGSVALFFGTAMVGLLAYMFIALPTLLATIAKVNPLHHFRAVGPALLTAFSTSSSAATLPITLDCMEKRVGVSNRICSFTIPLGTSLNLSGSALYQCMAVLFIGQVYGIDLSLTTITLVILMTLLTSIGMAGIPSAALISVVLILHTIGAPAEGIGLVMAVERIMDMCRTVVNVFSNTCCAVMVARTEGEKNVLSSPSLANLESADERA